MRGAIFEFVVAMCSAYFLFAVSLSICEKRDLRLARKNVCKVNLFVFDSIVQKGKACLKIIGVQYR